MVPGFKCLIGREGIDNETEIDDQFVNGINFGIISLYIFGYQNNWLIRDKRFTPHNIFTRGYFRIL